MATTYRFELPWAPTANSYYRRHGSIMHLSHEGRRYQQCAVGMSVKQFARADRVEVALELYPPNRIRWDIDNRVKPILDALEYAGILPNDEQVDRLVVSREAVTPPHGLVVVSITKIGERHATTTKKKARSKR